MLSGLRRLKRIVRRRLERDRPVILTYHRVAIVACDPWALAVRPDRFVEQIEALAQERSVVPLSWLVKELNRGRLPKRTVAITFDDGYADVLTEARPILERRGCPATVFLTTGAIGRAEPFWWDDLAHIVFAPDAVPAVLQVEIGGRRHSWRLADDAEYGPRATAPEEEGAVGREALHRALWTLLRPLHDTERTQHLARLAAWVRIGRLAPSESRAMDVEEVHRLHQPGFIDIGAHSVTHPSLPLLDRARREAEVKESKRTCEELAGVPVDGFAYPFGDHDDASVTSVRDARFVYACTTGHGTVHARSDLLRLPRAMVEDWSGNELMRFLGESAAWA